MRASLALGPRQPLSRQTAWGCLTTNLALPGFGTLAAGRIAGYPQAALAVGGMLLTTVFGLRFILWFFANWSRMSDPQNDPVLALHELWLASRWALLGIAIFFAGWLWALGSSLRIIRTARADEVRPQPPPLA